MDTTGRVGSDGGLEPEEPKPEEQPTAPLTDAEDAAPQEAESARNPEQRRYTSPKCGWARHPTARGGS